MAWAAVIGAGGAIAGGLIAKSGSSQSGTSTSTTQQQLDPRAAAIIYGDGTSGNTGLLSQYQGMLNKPEDANLASYGQSNLDYLSKYGSSNLNSATSAANSLMGGNTAPTAAAASYTPAQANGVATGTASTSIPAYAGGSMVQAPSQNNIDLTSSYNSLLSGGDTTALNNSMNSAVNATNAGFNTNLANLTNTLQRSVLPGIRSDSVLSGQYGGSRQGIAEGNAISDYTNQAMNANTQLAATNSANTTAQAASAYQQGQDRALSATQGLGAQQYGVASQDANTKSQAEFMNVQNAVNAQNTNAAYAQQSMNLNAQLAQQTNLANQAATNAAGATNAGYAQQTGLANQSSQLQTNSQNNASALSGAGLLSGLSSQAYGVGTAQNNYGLTQAQAVNGLLAPYLSANGTTVNTSPTYTNTGANVLGGATAGLGLYNSLNNSGLLSGLYSGTSNGGSIANTLF